MDHPLAPADPPPIDGVYNVYNAKEAPSPSPRPASTAGTHPTPPDVFWTSNYHQAKQKMEKFKKTVNDVVRINRVKKTIAARAKEDTIKFLRTTPLHGFDYIADAENKLQFAFWALLMLFVSAFAVRDTVNMIISYKEAPPAVSSLEAIILPMNHFSETALCLLTRPEDYQPFEFNATLASITNEFYERINILMNRVMNDPTSSMAQALEEIINDKNIQTSRISVKEDQYNHMTSNIKGEVFSLLTAVSAMESYPFTQLGVDRNIVPFVKLNSLKQFYSNRNASIPNLAELMGNQSLATFGEVLQLFSDFAVVKLRRLLNEDAGPIVWEKNMTEVVWLDHSQICYRLENVTYDYNEHLEVAVNYTFFNYQNLISDSSLNNRCNALMVRVIEHVSILKLEYSLTKCNYFSAPVSFACHNKPARVGAGVNFPYLNAELVHDTVAVNRAGTSVSLFMSVDGVYKSLPDQSGLTCSDDTMTNCHLKCKADVVNKQCDSVCIPTTLTGNPFVLEDRDIPLDKMCLVQNYQQCLEPMSAQEQEAAQSSLQACIKGCLPPCTRVRWSRRDSSSILHPKEKTNHVFKLYISNHAYPVFAQQYSWSLITVLSNVGGVAGVWLGASFVGVIHILAFIFKLCTAWMRTDEEDHDEESAGQGKDCAQKI